jgi:hypothetical protein
MIFITLSDVFMQSAYGTFCIKMFIGRKSLQTEILS